MEPVWFVTFYVKLPSRQFQCLARLSENRFHQGCNGTFFFFLTNAAGLLLSRHLRNSVDFCVLHPTTGVEYTYLVSCTIKVLVSCTIKPLVSCTSSVRCNSGSRLGGRFPVSVTANVLCISSCLVPAHVQISL